jgi:dipeptidyl aminopeptidase/acylaminoacyl peptidase
MNKYTLTVLYLSFALVLFSAQVSAQSETKSTNKWLALLENSENEELYVSPDGQSTIVLHPVSYPSLALLAQPRVSLGGLEFYTSISSRPDLPHYSHVTLIEDNASASIVIRPESGVIVDSNWAPDSSSIALLIQSEKGVRLWLYNVAEDELNQLSALDLSTRLGGRNLRWLPDSSAIVIKASVDSSFRATEALLQPRIESTEQYREQGRTYRNLLDTEDKQQHFKSLAQSRLVKIDLLGNSQSIGQPDLVEHFAVSPDGHYLLVESLPQRLSAYTPHKKWGREYRVLDLSDNKVVYQLPALGDKINLPKAKDSVPMGARDVQWLPFENATISWAEATDKGVMATQQPVHDHVYTSASPFTEGKQLLLEVAWRFHSILWSRTGTAILHDWRYEDKQLRSQLLKYQHADLTRVISQRNYRDIYTDSGDPVVIRTSEGNQVLIEDAAKKVFLLSLGKSKTGTQPYIDSYDLHSGKKERVFTSSSEALETPITVTPEAIIVRRETSDSAPEYLELTGKKLQQRSVIYRNSTQNSMSYPPEVIDYERSDGLQLQGTLHLPNDVNADHTLAKVRPKIPAVLWIYPKKYEDKKLSQQFSVVNNRFRHFNPLGPLPLLHDGIAVFESPSMPILSADGGEPNDHFIEQLVMNAEAAVKALDKTGVIDVQRLAVMGHSYGAFAVANLLAHTDLFNVGVARSGAYTRSLPPFGFQGEQRNLWKAKNSYLSMSPFLYADQINEPLLLIHGENDLNSGTFPMQSTRMYDALVANKQKAKLVMLPYEGHAYRAKESLYQVLTLQSEWLNRWLEVDKVTSSSD